MRKTLSFLTILGLLLLGAAYIVTTYHEEEVLKLFQMEPINLTVYAPSSLRESLSQIKTSYEAENSRVTLNISYKTSYEITEDIIAGERPDLAIVASQKDLTSLNDQALIIPDTQKALTENTLVLIAPADSKMDDISDLDNYTVEKIATGDPDSTSIGHYTETVLKNMGLYRKLEYKLTKVKNVSTIIEDVINQTDQAGIVFKSDAVNNDKIKIVYEFPQEDYTPVVYTMFEPAKAENEYKDVITALEEYLISEPSQQVFNNSGFTPVTPSAQTPAADTATTTE